MGISVFGKGRAGQTIVLLCGEENGERIYQRLDKEVRDRCVMLCVPVPDWNRDLSPWPAPRAFERGEDFSGGAPAFLEELLLTVISERRQRNLTGEVFLAGYSLAGLFAMWAAVSCSEFSGFSSVSGAPWYDGLEEWVNQADVSRLQCAYFSLGEKEGKVRNPRMCGQEVPAQHIFESFQLRGIPTEFVRHPGGHFSDPEGRLAYGISRMYALANGGK